MLKIGSSYDSKIAENKCSAYVYNMLYTLIQYNQIMDNYRLSTIIYCEHKITKIIHVYLRKHISPNLLLIYF